MIRRGPHIVEQVVVCATLSDRLHFFLHVSPQVVPTVYSYINNQTVSTNQFSVTENFRESQPGPGRSLPGVFFFFELSPIKVRRYEGDRITSHEGKLSSL